MREEKRNIREKKDFYGNSREKRNFGGRLRDNRRNDEKLDARSIAFEALFKFFIKGYDLESTVDKLFDQKDFATKTPLVPVTEKKLAYEIIYGVLRNKSRLDFAIDKYLVQPVREEEELKILLEIGCYQILFLTRIPDFAAVNESVNLCKKNSRIAKFSDLVNAVLRKIITEKSRALEIPNKLPFEEKIALEYSHPLWLVERWVAQFGKTPAQKILQFNNSMPDIFVRRNSCLTNKNKFEATIAKSCANNVARAVGFNSLYYKIKAGERIEKSDLFLSGQCTIQATSSGWVAALLDVENSKSVLDLCAAPGGKSTLISEIAPNSQILAVDINFKRAKMISDTIKRLLIKNVDIAVADAKLFSLSKKFDYVLIDAPCSATGVINHHPESRWIRSVSAIENAAAIQKELLQNAAQLVEKNGVIVYSTCSLENEENREVVEFFLKENPDFTLISAKEKIADSQLLSSNGDFLEITPNKNFADAIFAARFQKKS
ncbi:MAG: 16S rRNA (cytosine(967)-C(5))-methyltransferase RsmB [Chitinivibrionia bacterium]|nr:16S rRNA (cytosine(967)-C(5))-methyltransferase RsmB [Chitinivibrionia bacterium]